MKEPQQPNAMSIINGPKVRRRIVAVKSTNRTASRHVQDRLPLDPPAEVPDVEESPRPRPATPARATSPAKTARQELEVASSRSVAAPHKAMAPAVEATSSADTPEASVTPVRASTQGRSATAPRTSTRVASGTAKGAASTRTTGSRATSNKATRFEVDDELPELDQAVSLWLALLSFAHVTEASDLRVIPDTALLTDEQWALLEENKSVLAMIRATTPVVTIASCPECGRWMLTTKASNTACKLTLGCTGKPIKVSPAKKVS